jgi:sensor histidine kinase YesM
MQDRNTLRTEWLFLFIVACLDVIFAYAAAGTVQAMLSSVLYLPVCIAVFLFFQTIVFRSVFKRKSILGILLGAMAGVLGYYLASYFVMRYGIGYLLFSGKDYFKTVAITDKGFIVPATFKLVTYLIYALLFAMFEQKLDAEKQNAIISNQKLLVEYNYLKSQINPHFLYNTLSFFYSRMLKKDRDAANGVAALSDIMRYSLEVGDAEGKVPLEKEVEQIENYIMLQQLRFDGQLHIDFKYNTPLPAVAILPHAFITIVENAFKHGVTDDSGNPLRISLRANEQEILFEVKNKKSNQRKDNTPGGLGLQNLRERLALAYPGKHQYLITDNNNDYASSLRITT